MVAKPAAYRQRRLGLFTIQVVLIINQLVSFSHRWDKLAKRRLFTVATVITLYTQLIPLNNSRITLSNTM